MTYPLDFPVPRDTGGPGAGSPIGGFGGNPAADQAAHQDVLARVGKAPVLLVHGNGGAADRLRIRIWHTDTATGAEVVDYDNQGSATDSGNLVVHGL